MTAGGMIGRPAHGGAQAPLWFILMAAASGALGVGCASTMSESEPPSARSPQVVGLAPAPLPSSSSSSQSDVAIAAGAPERRSVTVTGATAASEREGPPALAPLEAPAPLPASAAVAADPYRPACGARIGPRALRRAALLRTLDAGLGAWLRGVDVEGRLERGHFQGWLVRSIYSGDPCWSDVDLLPGDVVTRINHRPIERPEEAQAVWTALRSSTEIVVDLIRDGRARTLKFSVVDVGEDSARRPR